MTDTVTTRQRVGKRLGLALAAGGMVAGLLMAGSSGAAAATPGFHPAGHPVCNVGNINNGKRWEAASTSGNAWAEFYEHGDRLRVADRRSDGRRAEVEVKSCFSGTKSYYDSGPNEGNWDQEWYGLDRTEGEVIIFRVCDKRGHSCSGWQYVNA